MLILELLEEGKIEIIKKNKAIFSNNRCCKRQRLFFYIVYNLNF